MATYQSSLIEALRNRPMDVGAASMMRLLPNPVVSPVVAPPTLPTPRPSGIFNPAKLTMEPAVITPKAPEKEIRPEEFMQMPYDIGGGTGWDIGSFSDGYGVGQGVDTDLADLGLALMAYGEAGKGLAPGSLIAGIAGNYIAGKQADAMGRAADTLAEIEAQDVPGVVSVADRQGNVFGYSSPATIAASDAATFGTSLSPADAAIAAAMAGYAESAGGDFGGGYGTADGWGGDNSGSGLGW